MSPHSLARLPYPRLAVLLLPALVLASCSQGFSRAEAVTAFAEAHPEASTMQSTCVVDRLIEQYETEPVDEDSLDGLEAALLAEPPTEAFLLDQFRAMFGCGLTDEVESQLVRELEANGIDPDKAGCVAAELSASLDDADLEVLINDEMTPQFYEKFFDASEACGALPG